MENGNPAADNGIEEQIRLLRTLLRDVIDLGPFSLDFSFAKHEPGQGDSECPLYVVDFSGPDTDLLLEKNATLLHALEHVMLKAIRLDDDHSRMIAFDCNDWRQMHTEELRLMAQVAAERVVDTGLPFALSAMNSRDRRIIHLALRDHPQVQTQSEGVGPERKVVIRPTSNP
jgi:spoIIIJ-associated protein